MMSFRWTMLAVAGCLMIAGCTGNTSTEEAVRNAASDAKQAADTAMEGAKEVAQDVAESARDAASEVKEAGEKAVDSAADAVKAAGEQATETAGAAAAQVREGAAKAIEALGEGFSGALEKATSALKDVEGGGELLKHVTGLFTSAQQELSKLKDSETAEAAVNKLGELTKQAEGLPAMLEKLPAEAKAAVMALIEKGKAHLDELVKKVESMPAVQEIVKPKLDELMKAIDSLKSSG